MSLININVRSVHIVAYDTKAVRVTFNNEITEEDLSIIRQSFIAATDEFAKEPITQSDKLPSCQRCGGDLTGEGHRCLQCER